MYAKVFASLYQGTLRGQAHAILVFTNLLAHADRDGFVDLHFRAIADETGLTVDQVRAAIDSLEAPDPESRTPDESGRRIVRLDEHRAWGWRVVNYVKYRDIKTEEDRREKNRQKVAAHRAKQRSEECNDVTVTVTDCNPVTVTVTDCNRALPNVTVLPHTDAEVEVDAKDINTFCAEPSPKASTPATVAIISPTVLVFPSSGARTEWNLTEAKLDEYREAFPGIDALAECRKALQWIRDNPTKRKTYTGMSRFLGSWLGRAQDRAGTQQNRPAYSRAETMEEKAGRVLKGIAERMTGESQCKPFQGIG